MPVTRKLALWQLSVFSELILLFNFCYKNPYFCTEVVLGFQLPGLRQTLPKLAIVRMWGILGWLHEDVAMVACPLLIAVPSSWEIISRFMVMDTTSTHLNTHKTLPIPAHIMYGNCVTADYKHGYMSLVVALHDYLKNEHQIHLQIFWREFSLCLLSTIHLYPAIGAIRCHNAVMDWGPFHKWFFHHKSNYIEMWFIVTSFLAIISLQNFVYVMTAQICYVQSFIAIT